MPSEPATSISAAETYAYPSFYCTWYSRTDRPTVEPKGFVVFGAKPTIYRPYPDIRFTEGEDTAVWMAIQDAKGKWSSQAAVLSPDFSGERLAVAIDLEPLTIFFNKRAPKESALYFAHADYDDPLDDEDYKYICRKSDIGLPGGAMSGGN